MTIVPKNTQVIMKGNPLSNIITMLAHPTINRDKETETHIILIIYIIEINLKIDNQIISKWI
jgi:hypothetical protein